MLAMDDIDEVDNDSITSRCSTPTIGHGRNLRRPVVVKGKILTVKKFFTLSDGVIGCELNGSFSEESNFNISYVKMKVKIRGNEAGWIVGITDVLDEQSV